MILVLIASVAAPLELVNMSVKKTSEYMSQWFVQGIYS